MIPFSLECGLVFGCESSLSLLAKEVLVTIVPCAKSFLSRRTERERERRGDKYQSRTRLHNDRREKFELTYNYPILEWNWTRQVACQDEDWWRERKRASFWEYRKRSWDERWFACDPNDWRYPAANRNTLDDSLWNRDEVAWPVPCHRVYRRSS